MATGWSRTFSRWCRCHEHRAPPRRRAHRTGTARVGAPRGGVSLCDPVPRVDSRRSVTSPLRPSHAEPRAEGVLPTLAELIALRAAVGPRQAAPRGRHGPAGPSLSPLRGRGMEYAESREYVPGDDARHVDWRVTARSGRLHTKLFQTERERLTLLVADTSPALYFGTRVRFKSVQAARAGAVAAWRAVRDGDRIGALRASRREPPVPPASGGRGALRVLDALVRWYRAPQDDDAGLDVALEHAVRLIRPGARVVVLADPHAAAAVGDARWTALAQHHEAIALLLADPLEAAPPKAVLSFADGEGHRLALDLAGAAMRQRWQAAFATPANECLQRLPRLGVRARLLSTDAPSESWLGMLGTGVRR